MIAVYIFMVARGVRFELTRLLMGLSVFKTELLSHLSTPAYKIIDYSELAVY